MEVSRALVPPAEDSSLRDRDTTHAEDQVAVPALPHKDSVKTVMREFKA